jgi:magnesium transporter
MPRFLIKHPKTIGTAPGTLDFVGEQKVDDLTVSILSYTHELVVEAKDISIDTIAERIHPHGVNWINVYGLHNIEKIKAITDYFAIKSLTIEDILNTNHIPKYEEFDHYKGFIFKLIHYNQSERIIHAEQLSLIIFNNIVITFQEKSTGTFNTLKERIRHSIGRIRKKGHDYLVFAIIDTIMDHYLYAMSMIGQEIEEMDKQIFNNTDHQLIKKLYQLKTEIGFFRMQIRPVKEMMMKAIRSDTSFIHKSTKSYFNDLIETITQANNTIELYNLLLSDQINTYNALINNHLNQIMKVLTVLTSIFIPLTFITGIYGMNFENMPELKTHYGYFILWSVILTLGLGLFFFFKKHKWL